MSADDAPPPEDDLVPESMRTRENQPLTEELARATLERDEITQPGAPAYARVAESLRPPPAPVLEGARWPAALTRFIDAWTKGERALAFVLVVGLAALLVGFVVTQVSGNPAIVFGEGSIVTALGGPRGLFSRLIVWLAMVGFSVAVARVEVRRKPRLSALGMAALAVVGLGFAVTLGGEVVPDFVGAPFARAAAVTHEGVFRLLLVIVSVKLLLRAAVTMKAPEAP